MQLLRIQLNLFSNHENRNYCLLVNLLKALSTAPTRESALIHHTNKKQSKNTGRQFSGCVHLCESHMASLEYSFLK